VFLLGLNLLIIILLVIFIGIAMMTIFELRDIIKKYGVNDGYYTVGCELLEYIKDVPGFVSLLREFSSDVGFNFVDGYLSDMNHDPIKFILTGDVTFSYDYLWVFVTVGDEDFYYRGEDDPNEVLRKRKR
jgi:hypothetical protein